MHIHMTAVIAAAVVAKDRRDRQKHEERKFDMAITVRLDTCTTRVFFEIVSFLEQK